MFVDLLRSPVMAIGEDTEGDDGIVVHARLLLLLVHFQLAKTAVHVRRRMPRGVGQRRENEKRTSA